MVPDYYARLGVDPGADAAEIEAALKQQQPVWSMGTRNPKTRHTNQLYLDEVPALRRALLSGPEPRAAYDAELAAVQIAEREQKLDELQRRVRLRAAKGGLTTADRSLLRAEAARLGLDGDVLDRLTRLIPTLTTTTGPADVEELDDDPPADALDPATDPRGPRAPGTARPVRCAGALPRCSGVDHHGPSRRGAAAVDEESAGHGRKDGLARDHRARPVSSHVAQGPSQVRSDLAAGGRGELRRRDRLCPPGIDASRPGNPRCAHRGSRRAGDRLGARRPADRTGLPQAECQARRGLGAAPA